MFSVSGCVLCDLRKSKEMTDKLHTSNLNEVIMDCNRRWSQKLLTLNGISAHKCM